MNALVHSREYLAGHRRSIIGRSLAAALAGALPIPMLDEWLVASIRRGTIRRIAESHGVDIDEDAVRAIADGKETPPSWPELVGGGLAIRLLSRQWRKMMILFFAAKRARAASRNFEVATLFDHYCARVHVGFGLDYPAGLELRGLIDQARKDTSGGISRHLFRRGLIAAAKTSVKAPVGAVDLLSRGRLRKLLSGSSEIEAVTEVDEDLEKQLRADSSFLSRSAAAIELELAADRNPYLDNLLDNFDRLARRDVEAPSAQIVVTKLGSELRDTPEDEGEDN